VEKIKFKFIPRSEVAKEYRVSPSAISDVMTKLKKNPDFIKELAYKKWERDKAR
jgi:DNA-binding IscR family transcriptional regulator